MPLFRLILAALALFYQIVLACEIAEIMSTEVKTTATETCEDGKASTSTRMPVWFLSHGGGPSFMLADKSARGFFKEFDKDSAIAKQYRELRVKQNTPKPKAILCISAHWESSGTFRVTSQEKHASLYYDYGGFGDKDEVQYPAPGSPTLAKQVCSLLSKAGFECQEDKRRNLDHGCFNVMAPLYPDADIPVVQLSIDHNYDPQAHLKIGLALSSLRDEGVHIIGSGEATHNFDALFHPTREASASMKKFVSSLNDIITAQSAENRNAKLVEWAKLPGARVAHPQEDHLVPLFVIAGAAGGDVGKRIIDHWAAKDTLSFSSWSFG